MKTQYKISSLSPGFLQNGMKNNNRKRSQTNFKNHIGRTQELYNFIKQVPQQHKISTQNIKIPIYGKNDSQDQLAVAQCKTFENKIKLKKKENTRLSNIASVIDQINKSIQQKQERQQYNNQDSSSNFAQQYRQNLRRTVFNQTKKMVKMRKIKQNNSYQTLNEPRNYQNGNQGEQVQIFSNKNSFHNIQHRHGSQRLTGADTMYKTLIRKQSTHRQFQSYQLDISKFPLITRNKSHMSAHQNFSNLLMALNNRDRINKTFEKYQQSKQLSNKKANKRTISRGSNFQKQEIKPWDTIADQFMD